MGAVLPKDRTEQRECRENTCHDFQRSHLSSPFVGNSFFSLTLRSFLAPGRECRAAVLVLS
jgi:hypothetical protein